MPTITEFANVTSALDLCWTVKNQYGHTICTSHYADEDVDMFLDLHGQDEPYNFCMSFGDAVAYIKED